MKIKLKTNITAEGVNHLKGSEIELNEKDAKSLIARKFAEEVKCKKATPAPVEEPKAEAPKPAVKKTPAPKAAPKKAATAAKAKEALKKAN